MLSDGGGILTAGLVLGRVRKAHKAPGGPRAGVGEIASGPRVRLVARRLDEQALPGRFDGGAFPAGRRHGVRGANAHRSGSVAA